ncbi:MAG: aminopeptidase P family protein [Anaerolineales bacterium]|nr:aminopeptidase P family protein [Anaerolineales bacterium]
MRIPQSKIDRIQQALRAQGLDGLFCRLSANVLALTGHWSGHHAVAAVVPAAGRPTLLVPHTEYDDAAAHLDQTTLDLEAYAFESVTELRSLPASLAVALPGLFQRLGLERGLIGVELSAEDGAPARMGGDFRFPAEPTWAMLRRTFPHAALRDAGDLLGRLRWVKSQPEIEAIRKAIEIASLGFAAAQAAIRPGLTEAELAAAIEAAILSQGTGRNGARLSRGFAAVYAGARSAQQHTHWAAPTGHPIAPDDWVILELGSVTDGYWSDLTRHVCAGAPSDKALRIYEIVLEAQRQGLAQARPGAPVGGIDRACRAYIQSAGYGDFFPHPSGHGVGYNYHEGPPNHSAFGEPLEPGMVLCVEPGIYLPGEFGIRAEDIIVITETGAELLSHYPHQVA